MWCHVSIHSSLVVTTASAAVSERKRIVVVVVVRARRTMKTFAVVGRDFALGWGLLTSKSHRLESAVRETYTLWQNRRNIFGLHFSSAYCTNRAFHFPFYFLLFLIMVELLYFDTTLQVKSNFWTYLVFLRGAGGPAGNPCYRVQALSTLNFALSSFALPFKV